MNKAKIIGLTGLAYVVVKWIIRVVMLFVVPHRRDHTAAYAWLMLIMLFPVPGLLLYLLIGDGLLSRKRREQQRFADETVQRAIERYRGLPEVASVLEPKLEARQAGFARLNEQLGAMPIFAGNKVEFLPNYNQAIARLIEDIDHAQRFVHVEYFIFADDESGGPVVNALLRASWRGVKVRVLIDHFGSIAYGLAALLRKLRAGGVEAHRMLPVDLFDNEWSRFDLRNHRKIVVIDNAIAYTGSQNLVNSDYNKGYNRRKGLHYEELVARITGPAVLQLAAVFAADWFSETNASLLEDSFQELAYEPHTPGKALVQVVPSGPGHDTDNNALLFAALIHQAQQRIVIATPYFVPDIPFLNAVTTAARRGVDVRLIVSGIADQFLVSRAQRSFYDELLQAGVRVYLFNAPMLLHAKNMSIDNDIVVIGSSNLDLRSFRLNMEVSLLIFDQETNAKIRVIEGTYLVRSTELQPEHWQKRPFGQRFVQALARLTSDFV